MVQRHMELVALKCSSVVWCVVQYMRVWDWTGVWYSHIDLAC